MFSFFKRVFYRAKVLEYILKYCNEQPSLVGMVSEFCTASEQNVLIENALEKIASHNIEFPNKFIFSTYAIALIVDEFVTEILAKNKSTYLIYAHYADMLVSMKNDYHLHFSEYTLSKNDEFLLAEINSILKKMYKYDIESAPKR